MGKRIRNIITKTKIPTLGSPNISQVGSNNKNFQTQGTNNPGVRGNKSRDVRRNSISHTPPAVNNVNWDEQKPQDDFSIKYNSPPALNGAQRKQLTPDPNGAKDDDKGLGNNRPTPTPAISKRINTLQNDIAKNKEQVTTIIRTMDGKSSSQAIAAAVEDLESKKQILTLSNLKQSLATNQIMLIFQQQAELLQDQVDRTSSAYVQYNSEEKKLIAKIQQEATALYDKGVKLDELVADGANQKRADKLANSELLDTEFQGLTNTLRKRDKGLQLTEVNPHYKLKDLKVILKQFQKANKEMDGLLKMPDLSKRCGLLASLYDGASTLAKKAVFLVPQTAVAAFAVVEYGIATVLVDTVKQGWTSAKEAAQPAWDKMLENVASKFSPLDTYNQKGVKLQNDINQNTHDLNSLVSEECINSIDTLKRLGYNVTVSLNNFNAAQDLIADYKTSATKILKAAQDQIPNVDKSDNQFINELEEFIGRQQKIVDLVAKQNVLNNQLQTHNRQAKDFLFSLKLQLQSMIPKKYAAAILGASEALIRGGLSGVGKTIVTGLQNVTINAPSGIAKNYDKYAKPEVEVEGEEKVRQDRFWNKSLSEIHTPNKDARTIAYREKVEAAEAKKILANEAKGSKTKSNEFKLAEGEKETKLVRQNGQAKLGEYITETQNKINKKEEEIANRIGGVQNLIQPSTPENVIKNTVLKNDKDLLNDVVALTKLQQQNAVSNIMLAFAEQAASLEQQVYYKDSKEQKLNEEIQDLMQTLAEKASVLNEKVEKEINSKRSDSVGKIKKSLTQELTKALNANNMSSQNILSAVTSGDYTEDDLKRIKKVFEKANNYMDGLLAMPDASKRCGLLASLYDLTTTLAKSAVFLVPQTAAAAVSIIEYGISTVLYDTVKQGLTSMQNAGSAVWEKRNAYIETKILQRNNRIVKSISKNREEAQKFVQDFIEKADEIINTSSNNIAKKAYKETYEALKKNGIKNSQDVLFVLNLCKVNNLDFKTLPQTQKLQNLEKQFKKLDAQLDKAKAGLFPRVASAILGVPAALIWGGLSGVGKTIVTGLQNVTTNVKPGIARNYESKTTVSKIVDDEGQIAKKSWARNAREVYGDDTQARGESHKDKAERGLAARELARRVKNQGKPEVPGH